MLSGRRFYWIILLLSLIAIAISLYMQFVMNWVPCVLCIMQRVVVMGLGLLSLIALVQHPKYLGRRVYHLLFALCIALGLWFSGRQVWLQHLPPGKATSCGPGLDYLVQALPPDELLGVLFAGSGDCAQVHWSFLGVSIAGWTFCFFVIMALIVVYDLIHTSRNHDR